MNWESAIALIEMGGLLAIVISLVYLAKQVRQNSELIRQNTVIARAGMVHGTSVFYARFFEMLAESPGLAGIYRKALADEALEEDERIRFESLLEVYFTSLEDMDHQYKADLYFDEDDDEDLVVFMAPSYRDMLESRYGSEWWDREMESRSTPSFFRKIEKVRSGWKNES